MCDAEVRVEAICPQKRSNPSVPVRNAPRAFVGQVFNLRPISNRPPASVRQCRKGGLQARRRLETCPTKHRRIHFHVAHPPFDKVALKSVAPTVPKSLTSMPKALTGALSAKVMVSGVAKKTPKEPSVGIALETPKKPGHRAEPEQDTVTVGYTREVAEPPGVDLKLSSVFPVSGLFSTVSKCKFSAARCLPVFASRESPQAGAWPRRDGPERGEARPGRG